MKTSDLLMIAAMLIAPLAALQVQIWLETYRAYARRQGEVFRMLMMTRAARTSPVHIEALNRIDLEFYGRPSIFRKRWQTKAERKVIEEWRAYHSHLNLPAPEGDTSAFSQKRTDLFIALLSAISKAAGYSEFDNTHLTNMWYSPKLYADIDNDQALIREGLVGVLSGETALTVRLDMPADAVKKQNEVSDAILRQVGTDGILRVHVVSQDVRPRINKRTT